MADAVSHIVTLRIPASARDELAVSRRGHEITVTGPGGYRHTLVLSADADVEHLDVQIYRDVLELRAPHLPDQ